MTRARLALVASLSALAVPAVAAGYACPPPRLSMLPAGGAPVNTQIWLRFPAPSVVVGERTVELARGRLVLQKLPEAAPETDESGVKVAVLRQDFISTRGTLVRLSPSRLLDPAARYRVALLPERDKDKGQAPSQVALGVFSTSDGERKGPPPPPQIVRTAFVPAAKKPCHKCPAGPYLSLQLGPSGGAAPDALLYEVSYADAGAPGGGSPGYLVQPHGAELVLGEGSLCEPAQAPLPEAVRTAVPGQKGAPDALHLRVRTVDLTGESSEPAEVTVPLRRPKPRP